MLLRSNIDGAPEARVSLYGPTRDVPTASGARQGRGLADCQQIAGLWL